MRVIGFAVVLALSLTLAPRHETRHEDTAESSPVMKALLDTSTHVWCHTRRLAGPVTYHPGKPLVDRSDSPRYRPVPDAAASVYWVSRAKGSGVTAMESTC
jgi:hypothetical protein